MHGMYPDIYQDIIALHADGLKALAVHEPDVRDLLRSTLPYDTTTGRHTIQQLIESPGPVPYVRDSDTYLALSDVAAHAGVLLVNASGLHEAELLHLVDNGEDAHFREVTAHDVIALSDPVPLADHRAAALVAKAGQALHDEGIAVRVASFEPTDRPVLWWPAGEPDARGARAQRVEHRGQAAARRAGRCRRHGTPARAVRHRTAARPRPADGRPRRAAPDGRDRPDRDTLSPALYNC